MAQPIVKILGERNTGTRAMTALLRQVPDVAQRVRPRRAAPPLDGAIEAAIEEQMRGHWKRLYLHALRDEHSAQIGRDDPWKHALPRLTPGMISAGVRTVIMLRDPYSWLLALARRPYHIKGPNAESLEAFAARPWMTERRERLPAVLASPLDLWTRKARATRTYAQAAEAAGLPCALVRFEDFVLDPAAVAADAFRRLGLDPPPLRARRDNTKTGEASLAELQRYYREKHWLGRFSAETVARVNARIDWQAARALGYGPLDPGDFPERIAPDEARAMAAEMASLTALSHGKTGAAAAT